VQYLIGFVIALFIALTGVGAGTVTVPVLILFLGVPAPVAVGIGLMFATVVKLILVPAQIARRNCGVEDAWVMILGGVPGVVIGSIFLKHLVNAGSQNLLNAILGLILVSTAGWQIFFSFRPMRKKAEAQDRSSLLAWLMFPVGAEVGFSSAGAGALGSAALLSLTSLRPRRWWARTLPSACDFTDWQRRALVFACLESRIADSPDRRRRRRSHCRNIAERARPAPAVALCAVGLAVDSGGQFLFNSYQLWAAPHRVVASQSQITLSK